MQALHEKGQANADHTTLLLNCYTKLKDIAQLDKFVAVSFEIGNGNSPDLLIFCLLRRTKL